MRRAPLLAGILALSALAAPPAAAQAPAGPVTALTAGTLAALCGARGTDADSLTAIGYCRGFIVGIGQYHSAMTRPGALRPIFCLPDPAPTLEAAQASFIAWVGADATRAEQRAAEGLLRWAAETYPCAAPQPARRR